MRRLAWLAVLPGLLLALPRPSAARYEYARALGTRCSTCHDSHHPDIENLNAAGRYYLENKTLEGWRGNAASAPQTPGKPAEDVAAPRAGGDAPNRPRNGQPLFARNCAPCHGAKGEGTAKARPLKPPQLATSDAQIEKLVREGVAGTGMFGFADVLSVEQIRLVTAYVQTLRGR